MALIIGDQPEYNKSLTVAFFQTARPKHGIDMIISMKRDRLRYESETYVKKENSSIGSRTFTHIGQ